MASLTPHRRLSRTPRQYVLGTQRATLAYRQSHKPSCRNCQCIFHRTFHKFSFRLHYTLVQALGAQWRTNESVSLAHPSDITGRVAFAICARLARRINLHHACACLTGFTVATASRWRIALESINASLADAIWALALVPRILQRHFANGVLHATPETRMRYAHGHPLVLC